MYKTSNRGNSWLSSNVIFTDKDEHAPPPPYEEVCSMPGHHSVPVHPPQPYGKDHLLLKYLNIYVVILVQLTVMMLYIQLIFAYWRPELLCFTKRYDGYPSLLPTAIFSDARSLRLAPALHVWVPISTPRTTTPSVHAAWFTSSGSDERPPCGK